MKKKCAAGGMVGQPMQEQLEAVRRKMADGGTVRKMQVGGPVGGAPILPPVVATLPDIGAMPAPGVMPSMASGVQGSPDYSTGPKATGFTWQDGTRRDGLTPEQAQKQDAQAIAAPVAAPAVAPLQTMAEQQIARGINPNAAYKAGGSGDPHASGGMSATPAQRASVAPPLVPAPNTPPPVMPANPFDTPSRRSRTRPYADGGMVSTRFDDGTRPGKWGNRADGSPKGDGFLGPVARPDGNVSTEISVGVPIRGRQTEIPAMVPTLVKQEVDHLVNGGRPTRGIVNKAIEHAEQRIGQAKSPFYVNHEDSFADGGMVKFAGKGGPRDDQIPVKVAGEDIRVSDGESAVILPAKTTANPGAVQAIGQVIQQSNDGRAPDMGGPKSGGGYKDGLTPAQLAALNYEEQTGQTAPAGPTPLPASSGATGDFQNGATAYIPPIAYAGSLSAAAGARTNPNAYPYTGQREQSILPRSTGATGSFQNGATADIPAAPAKTDPNRYPYTGQQAINPYAGVSLAGMVDAVTPSAKTAVVRAPATAPAKPGMAAAVTRPANPPAAMTSAGATTDGISGPYTPESGINPVQAIGEFFADSARAARGEGDYSAIRQARAAQQQAAYSNEGRQSAVQSTGREQQTIAATPDPRIAETTGNSGATITPSGTVEANMGRGFDPTKLRMADGQGMISNAAGRTMIVSPDGGPRWSETQQYKDAIARNEADKLRAAEMQAVRQGMNPVQAIAETQGMAAAARREPGEAELQQQKIESGRLAAQDQQEMRALYAAHGAAKTPEDQARIAATIRARLGKEKEKQPDPVVLRGAQNFDGKEGDVGYALDPATGQWRQIGESAPKAAGSQGLPEPKSKAEMDKLPKGSKYVAPDGTVRTKP